MPSSAFISVNHWLSGVFPDRRIYIRSDARTRYLTIGPASQCGLALLLGATVCWGALTSYTFIDRAIDGQTAESRLEAMRGAYEAQIVALRERQSATEQELDRSKARGDAVARELGEKQRLLVDAATRFQTADAELDGLRSQLEALTSKHRDELAEIDRLNERIVALRLKLAEASRQTVAMDETLATFSQSMDEVISARDRATRRAKSLGARVATLQGQIGGWQTRQENLLAQIEDATGRSLDKLDTIFVDAGVDVDDILQQAKRDYTGRGGLFEPVGDDLGDDSDDSRHSSVDEQEEERVAALMGNLERVSLMRVAINRLPFGLPTEGAEVTSPFGVRSDPFRHHKARHEGVDLAAPKGTPIFSTAEGVVVFSGRQRGYGNVVKIRHAFGFETVYAHLSKSRVEVGQRVTRGTRIADMGSTGRSTGSHLHYEVRIDGQPVNPIKFIRAARNVLEDQVQRIDTAG